MEILTLAFLTNISSLLFHYPMRQQYVSHLIVLSFLLIISSANYQKRKSRPPILFKERRGKKFREKIKTISKCSEPGVLSCKLVKVRKLFKSPKKAIDGHTYAIGLGLDLAVMVRFISTSD